jgi:glutamate-1-semialdehyde 2,1-aminomutase
VGALRDLFVREGSRIAAVIVVPVAGNMGCVPPEPGFLEAIVSLCEQYGAVSIFDEVMTGTRLAPGGAQQRYGVRPAMTCLGKVVGGGMPLAVYGGRADIMKKIAPLGPVYQAGTLSGNPLAVTAGLKTLELMTPAAYDVLEGVSARLEEGLSRALAATNVRGVVQRVGSMLTLFFSEGPVRAWTDAARCDTRRFGVFHHGLTERGVYWPPSQFEAAFVSVAHSSDDIDRTVRAATEALAEAR